MPENTKYSYRDFSDRDLSDGSKFELYDHKTRQHITFDPANEIKSGDVIRGSCFAQQIEARKVFPTDVTGLEFVDCNCDNVLLPPGGKSEGRTCHKRIRPFPGTPINTEALSARRARTAREMVDFFDQHPAADALTTQEKETARRLLAEHDGLVLAIEAAERPQLAEDWFCDWKTDNPIEPKDKKRFEEEGRSIDPKDIPTKHVIQVEMIRAEYDKVSEADWKRPPPKGDKPLKGGHQWFKEIPKIKKTDKRTVAVEVDESRWQEMQATKDWAPFDKKPKVVTTKQRPAGRLRVSDRVRRIMPREKVAEMEREVPAATLFVLQEKITTYTLEGEGALYRGEGT